jgi:hypothetical protein
MVRKELEEVYGEALTKLFYTKIEYNNLVKNKIYNAYNVRKIDTQFGKKVVANLDGKSGIFFFPNKIQQAMKDREIGDNVNLTFRFLGFEKTGKYKTCKL